MDSSCKRARRTFARSLLDGLAFLTRSEMRIIFTAVIESASLYAFRIVDVAP